MPQAPSLLVLATDYDGTLAQESRVEPATWDALKRWRNSGRRAVLATGRELADLRLVCPHLDLFDRVVLEDGGTLYNPATDQERLLAERPSASLVAALREAGVEPLSVGQVVVATWEPHGETVARLIQRSGLPLRVSRNKRALMVLPHGVDKASGLRAALAELGLNHTQAVGIGDAENDGPLLAACALGVAVANAQPALRAQADRVTQGERGAGVRELITDLLGETSCDPDQNRSRSGARDSQPVDE